MNTIASALIVIAVAAGTFAGEVEVRNNCGQRIWVKNEGSNTGGFNLEHGQSQRFQLHQDASARVWAHTGCDVNGNNCDTTEGYVSLAEMHWDDTIGMLGFTWYDISQVDGYNLPISMEPFNPGAGGNCNTIGCNFNLNGDCPQADKVYNRDRVVGCRNPNRDAVTEYSRNMKSVCPNVYTWSQDDLAGMRACQPGNPGLRVTFC